jgi:methionyl-tRNA formyltransferase
MTPRIDAGGMIAVARTPIDPDETAGDLEERLATLGAPLVVEAIAALVAGTATIIPQDKTRVSKAPKLRKDDGLIDWSKPAKSVHDHVRAMRPWPIASTVWHSSQPGKDPLRLIVLKTQPIDGQGVPGTVIEAARDRLIVAAGSGAVAIVTVQVPGKSPMPVAEFLRGRPVAVGDRMGE